LASIIITASSTWLLSAEPERETEVHTTRPAIANGGAGFLFVQEVRMPIRGIRGATVVERDEPEAIHAATRALLEAIQAANPGLRPADLASAWFTATPDLCAAYPAAAARQLGWTQVPLMCVQEMAVPGSLARCIRVLLHWNTDLPQTAIQHVYLGAAESLRPDLSTKR
jgi:chorismate mutase